MSGRGRGGFRGGRGGRGGRPTNGTRTLGRDDAPFQIDTDVDVVLDGKPSELFPVSATLPLRPSSFTNRPLFRSHTTFPKPPLSPKKKKSKFTTCSSSANNVTIVPSTPKPALGTRALPERTSEPTAKSRSTSDTKKKTLSTHSQLSRCTRNNSLSLPAHSQISPCAPSPRNSFLPNCTQPLTVHLQISAGKWASL